MVFVQSVNGADQVMACCAAARRQGLGAGMRLADARALCPTLHSHSYDAARDRADLHHLALWARRYSPLTGVDERANGIWIDVAGAEHLFGDVRGLMVDCVRRLRRSGLRVRFAAAPTCGAAWALAHYARPGTHSARQLDITPGGSVRPAVVRAQIQQILAPLPLAALRIDQDIVTALHRAGLHIIDDIMMMPRAPLTTRFGEGLLRRLDQACGDIQESFSPLAPTQPMIVSRNFAEPIAAASDVGALISYLADEMARLLYHTGMAARRLELGWQLVDGGGGGMISICHAPVAKRHYFIVYWPGLATVSIRNLVSRQAGCRRMIAVLWHRSINPCIIWHRLTLWPLMKIMPV